MTIRSVKILLVCNTDFFGKVAKTGQYLVSILGKSPNSFFEKCISYRIFDKCDSIYAKMAKKIFLKKRRTTRDILQYWSVFSGILGKSGQYLVSNLGKSGQYSGQYTDFFYRPQLSSLGQLPNPPTSIYYHPPN